MLSKTSHGTVGGANVPDIECVESKWVVFNKRDVSKLSLHPKGVWHGREVLIPPPKYFQGTFVEMSVNGFIQAGLVLVNYIHIVSQKSRKAVYVGNVLGGV